MRVLAISDNEVPWLSLSFNRRRLDAYDLVIACGDLRANYLETIATLSRAPLVYVRGNHDGRFDAKPPAGCIDIEGKVWAYRGLTIAGLGGSLPYNPSVWGFTEREMEKRARKLGLLARATGGIDLLVTHAPVRGYGDLPDRAHQGYEAFEGLLERTRPQAMLHGHVHTEYGRVARELAHPSGARLINACGWTELEVCPRDKGRQWLKPKRV